MSDVVVVLKVSKIVKVGGGLTKIITESGKEIFVPSKELDGIPSNINSAVAVYDFAVSEDSISEKSKIFIRSLIPIVGSMDAMSNAKKYNYMYAFVSDPSIQNRKILDELPWSKDKSKLEFD